MLDRQIARRQWRLCQPDNLKQTKARGVQDVAFHKKCDIAMAEMVKSPWVYRRPRNFRAEIEAGISCLKPLWRCTLHPGPRRGRLWRGPGHFKAYIWSAVVAHNLMLSARLRPT